MTEDVRTGSRGTAYAVGAVAVALQAGAAITAIALAGALRDARAAYPDERYFIDSEASAAWTATAVVLIINLAFGVALALVARRLVRGRRPGIVAMVVPVVAVLLGAFCVGANPLSQQWDPDGHELVARFIPSWHRPALAIAAGVAAVAAIVAVVLLARLRRRLSP